MRLLTERRKFLLETEKQRRWWFATHPEYSWSRGGQQDRKQALPWWLEKDLRKAYQRARQEFPELRDAENRDAIVSDPHTLLDLLPLRRLIMAPAATLKALARRMTEDAIVSAAKRATKEGPGKWVEVGRSHLGLEHQSKMSGQPIVLRDGKHYINEYEMINPVTGNRVRFDDYRDGILYEYKKRQGNLINRKTKEFDPWCKAIKEAREEADRHLEASQGIPVIWRVGADQIHAYKKAVGVRPGLSIEP
jgi:hypothetical protein